MSVEAVYDPTLPRTIADLIHQYGIKTMLREMAAYCEAEWVQAAIRSEPSDHWLHTGQTLTKIVETFPSEI